MGKFIVLRGILKKMKGHNFNENLWTKKISFNTSNNYSNKLLKQIELTFKKRWKKSRQ